MSFQNSQVSDYELLQQIGCGSYGEVWLAQSVTGTLRAVKIVGRSRFHDERPYEREFEGIKRYEPISRKHDGLVEVLHVGQREGCFYYIMELADDATSGAPLRLESLSSQASYQPKTLGTLLRSGKRLPVAECLDIAERLASALAWLHQHELVHRDIKPSNVIFVGGHPKLADIGLVAGMNEARSLVGTMGYIPPEGPGSAQADTYSLGKVLYEMATGMDRNEFPSLPSASAIDKLELQAFAELNELIIKACHPDLRSRYQSAEELYQDIVLLRSGRSVRRLRDMERRVALARKVSLTAAMLAMVTGIAYFGSIKQIQRARDAEAKALSTVQTLLSQKTTDPELRSFLQELKNKEESNKKVIETQQKQLEVHKQEIERLLKKLAIARPPNNVSPTPTAWPYPFFYWLWLTLAATLPLGIYHIYRIRRPAVELPRKTSIPEEREKPLPAMPLPVTTAVGESDTKTGELTKLGRETPPTDFFEKPKWQELGQMSAGSISFDIIIQSFRFYREHLTDEYEELSKQATITYRLWVACVMIGFSTVIMALVMMMMGNIVQGLTSTLLLTPMYFILKIFNQREDHYREKAAAKNAHLEYGNQWQLTLQSIEMIADPQQKLARQCKLVETLLQKIHRTPNGPRKKTGKKSASKKKISE